MSAPAPELDIRSNRAAAKWSKGELAARFTWECCQFLFSWSPRQFWSWRAGLLRLFGARIGRRVHLHPTVRIAIPWNLRLGDECAVGDRAVLYSLGPISIGPRATVSQHAHLCAGTHDHTRPDFPLLKTPIEIGADAWVCADAFVGPGVRVGNGAIVAARAVVVENVAPSTIVAGNPARFVRNRVGTP